MASYNYTTKHTPGPWNWSTDHFIGEYSGLYGPQDQGVCVPVCSINGDVGSVWFDPENDTDRTEEVKANFELMRRAPALFDVLVGILNTGWRHDSESSTTNARRVAHLHGRLLVKQIINQ